VVARSFTPLWKRCSGGCHLNRPIADIIQSADFHIEHLDTAYLETTVTASCGDSAGSYLAHLVNCVASVVREGPYLGWPAALFDRVCPVWADKDVRTINLVYRAVTGAVMRYFLLDTADAHGKGLSRHPCHSMYTGYFEKIGNMLGIVDLIETKRYFELIDIDTCLALLARPLPRAAYCRLGAFATAMEFPSTSPAAARTGSLRGDHGRSAQYEEPAEIQ
jgi:hypothetical protein